MHDCARAHMYYAGTYTKLRNARMYYAISHNNVVHVCISVYRALPRTE